MSKWRHLHKFRTFKLTFESFHPFKNFFFNRMETTAANVSQDGQAKTVMKTLTTANPILAKMVPLASMSPERFSVCVYLDLKGPFVKPMLMNAGLIPASTVVPALMASMGTPVIVLPPLWVPLAMMTLTLVPTSPVKMGVDAVRAPRTMPPTLSATVRSGTKAQDAKRTSTNAWESLVLETRFASTW